MKALDYNVLTQVQLACPDATSVQTSTPPAYANAMCLNAQAQDIWVSIDNATPSATHGMRIIAGASPVILNFKPTGTSDLKAVSVTASAGKLDIVWLQGQ